MDNVQALRVKGALLLEVLIAAAVLSIGVLACLNIFSSSIYTASRVKETNMILKWYGETLFEHFLDPSGVNLEVGTRMLPLDSKIPYDVRFSTRSLNKEEMITEDGKEVPQQIPQIVQQPWDVEFFDTTFSVDAKKRKSHTQFEQVLFRYDQQRRQPQRETRQNPAS
ncbi:MAG: hypothetical protein HY582_03095 [Candidatus Omnitrophica bacterium]|nr:hypothetical protein [Candidatus Omnitrophota bacterium]